MLEAPQIGTPQNNVSGIRLNSLLSWHSELNMLLAIQIVPLCDISIIYATVACFIFFIQNTIMTNTLLGFLCFIICGHFDCYACNHCFFFSSWNQKHKSRLNLCTHLLENCFQGQFTLTVLFARLLF